MLVTGKHTPFSHISLSFADPVQLPSGFMFLQEQKIDLQRSWVSLAGIPSPYIDRYHTSNIQRYETALCSVLETPLY